MDGGVDEAGFLALDDERKAGALNVEAKLRAATLQGAPAVEFVRKIDGVAGLKQDRVMCHMDPAVVGQVVAEVAANDSFFKIPDWANELFHQGSSRRMSTLTFLRTSDISGKWCGISSRASRRIPTPCTCSYSISEYFRCTSCRS